MFYIRNLIFGGDETRIQKWLIDNCVKNHQACRPRYVTPFLPSRVLDVREYPAIRLINTRLVNFDDTEDRRYVALSYCWGSSMPDGGKTTSKDLEARLASMDIKNLPKTLKDAVKFTHSLRVPFLWVDALCILQDDGADWDSESSCMSQIYSRALITIAAGASDNCQGGFLKASYSKKDLPVPRVGGYGLQYDFQTQAEEPNPWLESFLQNSLFTRGWTLQERELSPSIIHYTSMHVVWECRELVCVYIRPLHSRSSPKVRLLNLDHWSVNWRYRCFDVPSDKKGFASEPSGRAWPGGLPAAPFESWRRMVETYSARNFTKAKDKLPAIAGLADAIQQAANCDYLAGLWKASLLKDLMWRRVGSETLHSEQDPDKYYAPSWSWAWTNFKISFQVRDDTDDAQVIEASITPENAKVNLTGARLRLRARVFDIPGNTTEAKFYKDLDDGNFWRPTRTRPNEILTICILRTCKTVDARWGGREGQQLVEQGYLGGGLGLILQATRRDPSEYRRIGFVDLVPFERFQDLDYEVISII